MFTVSLISTIKKIKILKHGFSVTRNCTKTVLGEKVVPLTENTLLGRMMIYLNNVNKNFDSSPMQVNGSNTINNLVHGKTDSLRKLTIDQIANLFYAANISILSHSKQNLRKVLDILDVECCLRLASMEPNKILKVLSAFMYVVPNRITEYKFYHYATDDIDRCLKQCTKEELIHFIFYIGLQKKSKRAQTLLKKCLRNFNKDLVHNLTIEDLCIICNSTFRTNTKISNVHLLDQIKQVLNDNLSLLKDPALLITLIKTIQHNHYQDDDLLSTISCTIFFNKTFQYYTFATICHLLSAYADWLYYDEELFNLFIKQALKQLEETSVKSKKTYLTEQMRTKDILVFLRCISTLNCSNIDKEHLENLITLNIMERLSLGEFKNGVEQIVDIILYLWMIGCRPYKLIQIALTSENVGVIRKNNPKTVPHLNLLLSIIEYEENQLFQDLHLKYSSLTNFNSNQQIKSRPMLEKLLSIVQSTSTDIEKFEINYQVLHLNILGISGYKHGKKAVNIELLDGHTCVKNKKNYPNGWMQLKLRILEEQEEPLITINLEDVIAMNTSELQEFLEDEINLIC
ncbi:hypothetical protein RN001_000455 [Aquatica leii]|uniref:Uncharacterized protein n=1 Tax=Aquatica leii TaxID=1421715 RepID=A0AAN7PEY1_9COLE|nr:hypothetical protein RN001_000455 [Aquatica leii]